MIEVNLLPGGAKRRSSRAFSFSMPSFGGGGGGGGLDLWMIGAVFAWILALGYILNEYRGTTGEMEELQVAIEQAVQDSSRFSLQSERIEELRSRRDSINRRIAVIQQIDQGRYIWAHVMDEVSRALPDYTWLIGISATSPEPEPGVFIEGLAGTPFAVALFVSNLEASPFFRRVELDGSTAVTEGGETVQQFAIELLYEQPPFDELDSEPLFTDEPAPPVVDTTSTSGGEE